MNHSHVDIKTAHAKALSAYLLTAIVVAVAALWSPWATAVLLVTYVLFARRSRKRSSLSEAHRYIAKTHVNAGLVIIAFFIVAAVIEENWFTWLLFGATVVVIQTWDSIKAHREMGVNQWAL